MFFKWRRNLAIYSTYLTLEGSKSKVGEAMKSFCPNISIDSGDKV